MVIIFFKFWYTHTFVNNKFWNFSLTHWFQNSFPDFQFEFFSQNDFHVLGPFVTIVYYTITAYNSRHKMKRYLRKKKVITMCTSKNPKQEKDFFLFRLTFVPLEKVGWPPIPGVTSVFCILSSLILSILLLPRTKISQSWGHKKKNLDLRTQ